MLGDHTVSLDLAGRVAIVTGASRLAGIGAAICLALASHGADILFTHWRAYDRLHGISANESDVDALEQRLRTLGARACALEVDLSRQGSEIEVLNVARDSLGPPAILVNNAAHSTMGDFETLDAATLDAHYATNVRAMALLSVEFARRFDGGAGGRIINLTSGQGVSPMPDELAYAASKGAVEAFTVSLAAGVAAKGITVNAIDPGATDTGWMSEDFKATSASRMAFGRLGLPSDAARLAVFLASDAGQWITGEIIHSRGA